MHRRSVASLAFAVLAMFAITSTVFAGKYNKVVNIGDKGAAWKNLIGIDDKKHSLADHKDAKLVVAVFTCNECPVAAAYENRLIQFLKDYQDKGVQVVAISVSKRPADSLDKMKIRAKERGFNFPYLHDPSQKIGREYGANVTPHVFLLDKDRTIAYMGAVDDNIFNPAKVKKHYLRAAVDALLDGKNTEITESRQVGCAIIYE